MLFKDKKNKKYMDIRFFDYTSTSEFYNEIMKTKFNHIPGSNKNIKSKTNNEIINDIKGTLNKFT